MKYLNDEITFCDVVSLGKGSNKVGFKVKSTGYVGNTVEEAKSKVLSKYEPVKTLEWLKEITGYEWFYEDRTLQCETNDYVYFVDDGICYISNNGNLIITDPEPSFEITLTPREFIEKIAKGDWI